KRKNAKTQKRKNAKTQKRKNAKTQTSKPANHQTNCIFGHRRPRVCFHHSSWKAHNRLPHVTEATKGQPLATPARASRVAQIESDWLSLAVPRDIRSVGRDKDIPKEKAPPQREFLPNHTPKKG
ncbi:hypothetical protein PVNG_03261, partial [Plasmodium vivax North Korean]